MAISERRNDRPAAFGPQRQRRMAVERSCCLARNAAAWRQGKKIANEPLRVKVGEPSERIVARDPPAKGRYGRGPNSPTGEQRLKGLTTAATTISSRQQRDRATALCFAPNPMEKRSIARAGRRCDAAAPQRIKGIRPNDRLPDLAHPEDRGTFSNSEAISASGALNRPRRSAGGMTASTASSFSEGSMRR